MDDLSVLNDPSQKLSGAVALAVVECSGDVEIGLSLGEIMFTSGHDSMVGLVVERTRYRDFDIEFFEWEVFARWQAAAQRDDTRCLEILRCTLQRAGEPLVRLGTETIWGHDAVSHPNSSLL